MPTLLIAALATLLSACAAAPPRPADAPARAAAPARASAPARYTAARADAVVDAVVQQIDSTYVIPERRPTIIAALRAAQKQGRYAVDNPTELAARLSDDLQAAGKDGHLYLRWAPDEYRAAQSDDESGASSFFAALGRRRNQGVEELRILPGNVRYLRYSLFLWESDVSGAAIDDAIRFLRGGDAVILDLRGNGGGASGAVQYLVSHFIAEPGRLLVTFHDELHKRSRESRVLEHLPAGRITGKPIYVLIDGGTGSAAEEFAYHVKHFKFGALIGQTTAGAAHNNANVPIAPGFMLSVSFGRPVHGVSGDNWEAVGIAPDTRTPARDALDEAQLQALRSLDAKSKDPAAKAAYAWARTAIEARRAPPTVAPAELARLAGRYGDRTVRLENGVLVYARPGRDDLELTPMSPELFAVSGQPERRVRFVRAGEKTTALEVLFEDGQRQTFPRAP